MFITIMSMLLFNSIALGISFGMIVYVAINLSLGLIQLFHAFNSKYVHQSIFSSHTFANKWFNWAILISALIMAAVEIPFLTRLFDVTELNCEQWAVVLGAGIIMILIVEIVKFFQRKMGKI